MSFFRRHDHPDDLDTDEETNDAIDPELRLRTVRTAASTIAESIRQEQRAERRKSMRKKSKGSFFRRNTEKRRQDSGDSDPTPTAQPSIHGRRRNVYVNVPLPADEKDSGGEPVVRYARNKVRTSSAYLSSISPRRALQLSCRVHDCHLPSPKSLRAIPSVSARSLVSCRLYLGSESDAADVSLRLSSELPLLGRIATPALQTLHLPRPSLLSARTCKRTCRTIPCGPTTGLGATTLTRALASLLKMKRA